MPELAEVKTDYKGSDGTVVSPEKKQKSKPCEIDVSLQERVKAGSIMTTVGDAKPEEKPQVF